MLARPEVGSREHILLWLAGKPADEMFNWKSSSRCACGQYSKKYLNSEYAWISNPELSRMSDAVIDVMDLRNAHCSFGVLYQTMLKKWRIKHAV